MPNFTINSQTTLADASQFIQDYQDLDHEVRSKQSPEIQDTQTQTIYEKTQKAKHDDTNKTVQQKIDQGRDGVLKFLQSKLDIKEHKDILADMYHNGMSDDSEHPKLTGHDFKNLLERTYQLRNLETMSPWLPSEPGTMDGDGTNFAALNNTNGLNIREKDNIFLLAQQQLETTQQGSTQRMSPQQAQQLAQQCVDTVSRNITDSNSNINTFVFGSDDNSLSQLDGYDMLTHSDRDALCQDLKNDIRQLQGSGSKTYSVENIKELAQNRLNGLKQNYDTNTSRINDFFSKQGDNTFSALENTDTLKQPQKDWLKSALIDSINPKQAPKSAQDIAELAQQKVNQLTTNLVGGPTLLTTDQSNNILDNSHFVVHSDYQNTPCPIDDLTADNLKNAGLSPKFTTTVDGKEYALSEPFEIYDGRVGCMAFVENSQGEYDVRPIYLSKSRGDWQAPSHFGDQNNISFLGKGSGGGKSSTVLPIDMQKTMNIIMKSMAPRELAGPSQTVTHNDNQRVLTAGQTMFYGGLAFMDNSDFASKVDSTHTGKPLSVDSQSAQQTLNKMSWTENFVSQQKYNLALTQLSPPNSVLPDFTTLVDSFDISLSDNYSDNCRAYIFQSPRVDDLDGQPVQLKYMFVRDPDKDLVFLAAVENTASDLNDFGVRESSFDLGLLGMGLVEYPEMLPDVFNNPRSYPTDDGYLPVMQFHTDVALLATAANTIGNLVH